MTMIITVDTRNGFLRVYDEFAKVGRTYMEVTYAVHVGTDMKVKSVSVLSTEGTTWRQRCILVKRVTRAVNAWIRKNEAAVIPIVIKNTKHSRDRANSYVATMETRVAETQTHLEESRVLASKATAALAALRKRQRELKKA